MFYESTGALDAREHIEHAHAVHALPPIGDKRMKRTGSDRQYQYLGDPKSSLLISYIRVVEFFHVLVMRKKSIIPKDNNKMIM